MSVTDILIGRPARSGQSERQTRSHGRSLAGFWKRLTSGRRRTAAPAAVRQDVAFAPVDRDYASAGPFEAGANRRLYSIAESVRATLPR